jgi:hypothetical protein
MRSALLTCYVNFFRCDPIHRSAGVADVQRPGAARREARLPAGAHPIRSGERRRPPRAVRGSRTECQSGVRVEGKREDNLAPVPRSCSVTFTFDLTPLRAPTTGDLRRPGGVSIITASSQPARGYTRFHHSILVRRPQPKQRPRLPRRQP